MLHSNDDSHSLIEKINVSKIIQILKDIKSAKDSFKIEIAAKKNYSKLLISKALKYEQKAVLELSFEENNWIILSHNFPEKAASNLLKIGNTIKLKNAIESFVLLINNLQNYFEALYILDLNCIILEPVEKSITTNWRLIKYNKFAFIKIDFCDPMDINLFNVTFYGKDHIIKELNETYNKASSTNFDDEEIDIYQKLCIMLKIVEFPQHTNQEESNDSSICSICLSQYDDENLSPIVCCENPKCEQLFHASCLNQHLNINSFKILSIAVGMCPYCKQKISSDFAGFMKQNNKALENNHEMQENTMNVENMDTT